jgi:nucleotide-binding universal stress UspA family protein
VAQLAQDEISGQVDTKVVRADDVAEAIISHAADVDLIILGLQRFGRRRKIFGDISLKVVRDTECGIIMVSRRG